MLTWQQRLLGKYDVDKNGCWVWNRGTDSHGYGKLKRNGVYVSSHRLSYEHHKGEIPHKMMICHTCDVPKCINPDHLFLGTASDNMQDASNKGRTGHAGGGAPKLSVDDVSKIQSEFLTGRSMRSIAREFCLAHKSVSYWIKRMDPAQ